MDPSKSIVVARVQSKIRRLFESDDSLGGDGGVKKAAADAPRVRRVGDIAISVRPAPPRSRLSAAVRSVVLVLGALWAGSALAQQLPYPIMFVTQFPITGDFVAIASVFGNHRASSDLAGRGGDLYIRYPDGTLRNLTEPAGYGNVGMQGANSIAVRDPAISWDGSKAIFSMVVGAPVAQYQRVESYFQLYEVTGLGQGQTAHITKVPNQPR